MYNGACMYLKKKLSLKIVNIYIYMPLCVVVYASE